MSDASTQHASHTLNKPLLFIFALLSVAFIAAGILYPISLNVKSWLVLVPLLPGFAALINGILLNKLPKSIVTLLAVGSVGVSFFISIILFVFMLRADQNIHQTLYNWIASDGLSVNVAFTMDGLSAVMALVVSGVGWLIHIYSIGYMAHDESYARYFTYLNIFTFSMLILVLADSMPLMFVGWEGVGVCSYLLIGFWFTDMNKAIAGKKAFIVNRIGDLGFVIAMLILFLQIGSLNFSDIQSSAGQLSTTVVTVVCLLLFFGATGKSAQIPLYVWLPDAMAGPTPVSALIHAATMVTAGVYMIVRLSFLYVAAPEAMMVVAITGAVTAIFAASIGLFQYDIKKVLAYSTVSQLGFMFLAVGVGAFTAGIFHLMTHAFFKACLFLGSGSVIHGMHEEQDIRKMGGLSKFMPITSKTFFISCLAIAGIPPLAAFFSKDEILYNAFTLHYGSPAWLGIVLWSVGAVAAAFTSFYMFRLFYLTFSGETRASEEVKNKGIHESPYSMTIPLIVLAFLAVVAGFIGMPEHVFHVPNLFALNLAEVLKPAHSVMGEHHGSVTLEIILMSVSTAIAFGGWFVARVLYKDNKSELPARLKERFKTIHKIVFNKYYVDEAYYYAFIRPVKNFSQFLWGFVDTYIIDGVLVHFTAFVFRSAGEGLKLIQTGNIQSYILYFLIGATAFLIYLWQGAGM